MKCLRWREGGAVNASGAALPTTQQQAPGPWGGDCRYAAVGGAGVAEVRRGVQGHDRHQPGHGEALGFFVMTPRWLCLTFQGRLNVPSDTAGMRLLLLACDTSSLTFYAQGVCCHRHYYGRKVFMSQSKLVNLLVWPTLWRRYRNCVWIKVKMSLLARMLHMSSECDCVTFGVGELLSQLLFLAELNCCCQAFHTVGV